MTWGQAWDADQSCHQCAALHESGSGKAYTRPGLDPMGTSTGYFWLPNSYWLDGWHSKLNLPGKAMLLIWLSATSNQPTFAMSYEQTPKWYGISERTAERGIRELSDLNLMKSVGQKVAAARSPKGYTIRYNRALTGDFSHGRRKRQHEAMVKETRGRRRPPASETDIAAAGGESVY